MTELRRRFIEDLQLQGKSERTQEAYVRAVRLLAEHVNTPPDRLSEEQIRQYFLYVTNVKKWSASTITQALCAIKIFYTITLKRDGQIFDLVQPQKAQKLPDILSHDEVMRRIRAIRLPAAPLPDVSDDDLFLRLTPDRRDATSGDRPG